MTTIALTTRSREDGEMLVVALNSILGRLDWGCQDRGGKDGSPPGVWPAQLKLKLSVLKIARLAIDFHSIWKQISVWMYLSFLLFLASHWSMRSCDLIDQ